MRRQVRFGYRLALTLSLSASSGCHHGADAKASAKPSSEGSPEPDAADDTVMADITLEEVRALCHWTADLLAAPDISDEQACVADILGISESVAECRAQVARCASERAATPSNAPNSEACDEVGLPEFEESCAEVSVGDYKACMTALRSETEKYISTLSCEANLGDGIAIPRAAACDTLYEHCPQVLPGNADAP